MKRKNKKPEDRRGENGLLVGVFDIGSNSVRFSAYDISFRPPQVFFDEKVICGLGCDLEKTGRLSKKGIARARKTLKAFVMLAEALGVTKIAAVATSAVRDAKDGRTFVASLKKNLGLDVKILTGEEEARCSARGVMGAFPRARGVIADLGGGSLELARIAAGRIAAPVSLPLGVLRLPTEKKQRRKFIDKRLDPAASRYQKPGTLYAVGGTWRAFCVAHQAAQGIKKPQIHGYQMTGSDVIAFAAKLCALSPAAIAKKFGIEKKRAKLLPQAALLLSCLVEKTGTRKVTFSGAGLRDGLVTQAVRGGRRLKRSPRAAVRSHKS